MSKYAKSIDFVLENANVVIQYRLRKEILRNLTKTDEENLLEKIYQTPHFKLVQSYVKPDGYIGSGCHSWANWQGAILHDTPLQDGETAARLLAYYAIPKRHPIIANFVAAMRDEDILRKEFSYIPPEIHRYQNRFVGINSGNSLMALIYTIQAMLGYGDDTHEVNRFQDIALKGFKRILQISSLDEILRYNPNLRKKYNYPYMESDEYFPDSYTLTMLAYSHSWRTPENIKMLANSLNRINQIMKPDNTMSIRINGKFVGPCFALNRPFLPFRVDTVDNILYRRWLTEIAMLGVGESVGIIRQSVVNVEQALDDGGILRTFFDLPKYKRKLAKNIEYPTAYADVRLEPDYNRKYALECDLTFWAIQFLTLVEEGNQKLVTQK
ncbi:hypothetical protein CLHUN_01010 [Ruminiclostridium hungatei]|uniref:Uncharacterized protein n=1 Tax=Ruminiclostridium hungatei TaxID=48256 RepID=A0A1V4SS61_RUMHU|nr:hypothetical protein [Ruminiclostridium hungatei]OPX46285.1 hypothetical protein CLHUN_01010 [Ruminiclostridium hungatei]